MEDNEQLTVGCVVLAAGSGERFGGNKLTAELGGKTLIRRALEAVPTDRIGRVAVVTRFPEIRALAESFGFQCVWNDRPAWGQSHSIRLGTEALRPACGAIVYMVADQPLLRRESVAALVDLFLADPTKIVAAAHNGVRGNPCVFPAAFFPELCALTGDTGGGAVIRRHPEALVLLETDARELVDADTPETLRSLDI